LNTADEAQKVFISQQQFVQEQENIWRSTMKRTLVSLVTATSIRRSVAAIAPTSAHAIPDGSCYQQRW
tara:strand:- start:304 stop:507 length:204 start_codon:yes stop_codon:yes gene_type:complete